VQVGSVGNELVLRTTDQERCRVDSSGRLLVGTSDGSGGVSKLVVQGASNGSAVGVAQISYNGLASAGLGAGTDIGYLRFTDQGSNSGVFAQITATADATTGANDYPGRLVFSTTRDAEASPTEACRIDNKQRLLIGTASTLFDPNPVLHVQGARAGMFKSTSGAGNETLTTWNDAASGTIYQIAFRDGAAGDLRGTISTNGSSTSYNTTSDYRLKENIAAVTDGITRLQQLKPSRFNFIADPVKTVDGFIAHEVQSVVPECVTGEKDAVDEDGDPIYQGIDQSKLVPLLTAALQEAIGEIESLKARVAALESA
jgi:hypothetical protein